MNKILLEQAASTKMWGGRFSKGVNMNFHVLNSSIDIDKRLYAEDIQGSVAYAEALYKAGLLSKDEFCSIVTGFDKILKEWDENKFVLSENDEDIHSANERRLSELIGEAGKKLHTGRSRNDQSVTDSKLWLRRSIDILNKKLQKLIQIMISRARENLDILMPGYTHLQRAQPVRWSHWLLSYAWYAKSDMERLHQLRERVNVLPLGSGAIAGTPFKIDREFLAKTLNFSSVTENSMNAVSDRDFVAEFLFWASLTSIHLSRLAEDLINFSTEEFGFVQLSDEFSTGSSLMPQKRNPDSMELIRGKTGTIIGKSTGFMTTLKGIPSTYNKDLQEDKEVMFSTFDVLDNMLNVMTGVLESLVINSAKCSEALSTNMLATDLAYYLVRKGIPFREAHHLVGKIVALSESKNICLTNLSLDELKKISCCFKEDVNEIYNFSNSVEQYSVRGGTSANAVKNQIQQLQIWIENSSFTNI